MNTLSLEGFFQMACILPERLLALVRPAFDLVLRRIRSLKRCVQACGCKIMTPRYALQFGSRLHFKRCQALPKETPFPFFSGTPFFGTPCFLFFFVFLSPAQVGSLEMQPGAKLQAYLGVIILQPHACTQRFRLRILRRTRSNAGRTSARSLSGRIQAIWKNPSKERAGSLCAETRNYSLPLQPISCRLSIRLGRCSPIFAICHLLRWSLCTRALSPLCFRCVRFVDLRWCGSWPLVAGLGGWD